ncbi:MAG: ABC transporter substrate-binding protein [Nocardioides sp.]
MQIRRSWLLIAAFAPLALAACAPVEETGTDSTTGSSESASPTASDSAAEDPCAVENLATLAPGTLTIGTDSPAYDPWFAKNNPSNGKGFESAVAYAVADRMGFTPDQVTWVKVPFNSSYKPGAKNFDFDINQISITPKRAQVVDFSDGYYQAAQAVITVKGSPAAGATSLADLAGLKLGAQTGTTSLSAIRDVIQPSSDPAVYPNTAAATQALQNGQVDAILADLPTAFYIVAVELDDGVIVGQFQPTSGEQEEFGMLFEKGSPLVPCVNQALASLTDDGTLAQIEQQWLSDTVDVPVLQ